MRDDEVLTAAERQVRAVLQPGDERVRGVIARALSPERVRHVRLRPRLLAAAAVALLAIGIVVWRASPPAPPTLHISGSGSVIVVTSDDGRRWVVDDRRESDARGQYVIAIPQ